MAIATIEMPAIKTSKNSSAVKLARACLASDKRLESYRKHNLELIKQYCGPYYATTDPTAKITREPLNTIYTIVSILLPNLVGSRVSSRIVARRPDLKPFASLYRLALDHTLDQIDYAGTLLDVATAAFFGPGITKTILDVRPLNNAPDFPNWLQDAGFPYVGQVLLGDYVIDSYALKREAAAFEGNKYRIEVGDAYGGDFDRKVLDRLTTAYYTETHQDKPAGLSTENSGQDSYLDYFEFIDVYVPREKAILTIAGSKAEDAEYLKEVAHKGPEGGPYNMLGYSYPDGNALPIPPVSMFYDLHLLVNALARKMGNQADRSKTILAYLLGNEDDGKTIGDASDGDIVGLRAPDQAKELSTGGVDPKFYQTVGFVRDLLNWVASNPDSLGGLQANAKTLGQDQLKLAQASARLAHMQALAQKFNKSVLRKVAWYLWTDPQTRLDLLQPLGQGLEIPRNWSPEVRKGEFPDYDIDVEPYVVSSENPLEQYRRMTELAERIIVPLADKAAAQGKQLDVAAMVQSFAEKLDIDDDISEWFVEAQPIVGLQPSMAPGGGTGGEVGGYSPATRGPQPRGGQGAGMGRAAIPGGVKNA